MIWSFTTFARAISFASPVLAGYRPRQTLLRTNTNRPAVVTCVLRGGISTFAPETATISDQWRGPSAAGSTEAAAPVDSAVNLNITLEQPDKKLALFGSADRYLRMIRDTLGVNVVSREDELRLTGDREQVSKAAAVLDQMQRKLRRQDWLSSEDVGNALKAAMDQHHARTADEVDVYAKGTSIKPKTEGQKAYLDAILKNDLTFCVGPAGTGKTYLAVAAAASMLKHGSAKRLVLARPAVEAGERLGFLPGDLQAKVNPYLRPLFDALHDMMDFEQVKR